MTEATGHDQEVEYLVHSEPGVQFDLPAKGEKNNARPLSGIDPTSRGKKGNNNQPMNRYRNTAGPVRSRNLNECNKMPATAMAQLRPKTVQPQAPFKATRASGV